MEQQRTNWLGVAGCLAAIVIVLSATKAFVEAISWNKLPF